MTRKVQIRSKGIKNVLKAVQVPKAVTEYIWNGFDADATTIEIILESTNNGNIKKLIIKDNGTGIPDHELDEKFGPFHQSEKIEDNTREKNISLPHGYKGVGRLTFFQFANFAKWTTVYENGKKRYKYEIEIISDSLDNYLLKKIDIGKVPEETSESTGTFVEFSGFIIIDDKKRHVVDEIIDDIIKEFGWFLELYENKGYSILINGKKLDYRRNIENSITETYVFKDTNMKFEVKFIIWKEMINKEYSYYYYINENNDEMYKETTTLNNLGDGFNHSVYIKSEYFNDFIFEYLPLHKDQTSFKENKRSDTFIFIKDITEKKLFQLRKPFLKSHSDELINDLEKYNDYLKIVKTDNPFEIIKKSELINITKELYEIQPKIFVRLNPEQKRIFIGFLKLLIDSNERGEIIEIMDNIINLTAEERKELVRLLTITRLNKIIRTIKLISDRYLVIESLKQLVYLPELDANERDHLQKLIQNNYWIFGEQYALVSADQEFETGLMEYLYILDGKKKKNTINTKYKHDRPDVFLCNRDIQSDSIFNIVVELKSPNTLLGEKEVSQVKRYMRTIRSEPRFNDPTAFWDFILVGNKYDTSKYIEGEIENLHHLGLRGLIHQPDIQFKFFVKPWSQVIGEFEKRHDFLNKKLDVEKDKIILQSDDPKKLIELTNSITSIS